MAEKTPAEERFRYIGFEVFPKQAKPIFESPEEEKKYLEKVRRRKFKFFFLEREHSLIEVPTLTSLDRTIVTISSLLIVLGFFVFPVGTAYVDGIGNITVSGLQYLLNLGNLSAYLALVSQKAVILAALTGSFLLLAALLGLLQLVSVVASWKTGTGKTVTLLDRLGLVPVLLWTAALAITLLSIPTPAWALLGVDQLGQTFHIARLISLTGWGLWVIFAGLLINSSIVGD